jgi:uncharacterized protein YecT (DUF1311 family)
MRQRCGSGVVRLAKPSRLVGVAIFAALIGTLAACGGGGSSSSSAPGPTAAPSGSAAPSGTASGGTAAFVPVVETFDPGHPAMTKPAPATCGGQATSQAVEQCYQAQTENMDASIDAVQQSAFQNGSPAQRTAILADDGAWLSAREPVCTKAFVGDGQPDAVDVSHCLLDESTARLDAVKGIAPPEAMLKSTDSPDPSALSWYTTPEGSRIAELDTQGDQSGGGIIAWIIIGGADGFVVNPSQFYFSDGSFTDPGVIQPPSPAYHRVGTGQEYQFLIDYSHLSAAPAGNPAAGFVYVPATPVAIWR